MNKLTSHAIVGEALAELIDHDEKDADRVATHNSLQRQGCYNYKYIFICISPINENAFYSN